MRSRRVLDLLRTYESRNVTFQAPDGSWPIVWDRARGPHVWDADGKKYLDLTAAFGVAAAGHANPRVVDAGRRQMGRLLHAMGDVHPHRLKAELARELSRITFERWSRAGAHPDTAPGTPASTGSEGSIHHGRLPPLPAEAGVPRYDAGAVSGCACRTGEGRLTGKTLFCNSGFEAVEAALKTALLATGKPGVIAFTGSYHGLGYGALATTHREFFRGPFASQLGKFGHFVAFPRADDLTDSQLSPAHAAWAGLNSQLSAVSRRHRIGAVLVEPVQGRGGIHVPPAPFLPWLRRWCDEHGALLVLDEIYTGFGRTGRWFACEHTGTIPDLICLGKALTGGFPLSACVGRAAVMEAWPETQGEALHTSTFLGHPVGCAMALAHIREIETRGLVRRSEELGRRLREELSSLTAPAPLEFAVRGLGLMAGLEVRERDGAPASGYVFGVVKEMLKRGYILLPEGEAGEVVSFTPPLTITRRQLQAAVRTLGQVTEKII
jgi:4-aminobutyrate aminotransferase-like enzyme